jgi:hypothetical protein
MSVVPNKVGVTRGDLWSDANLSKNMAANGANA